MTMRRSKLELHIDILEALARHGPLKLTYIMYNANLNYSILKQSLDILIQQNLVEERTLLKRRHKTKGVYAITGRGLTALKYFREVSSNLQIAEEPIRIQPLIY
jgi:predicted transcriptional regulator